MALAYRILDNELATVDDRKLLETELVFAGFLVCNSPLKEDTLSNIRALKEAAFKIIMITGDNLLTAANVGKQIEMGSETMILEKVNEEIIATLDKDSIKVDSLKKLQSLIGKNTLVCTSSTSELPRNYLPHIAIFARTSPSEKEYIVKAIKDLTGKKVLYAGDGTNDVGGLRAADVGIAVVGINNLTEIQGKETDMKNKQEEFQKKMNNLKTDFNLTFSQRIEKTQRLMR